MRGVYMEAIIRLDGVSYRVNEKDILSNINLSLYKGEIVALTGPNGAGKTTLSKVMMGVLEPTQGKAYIEEQDLETMKLFEVGRKIGYMFQNPTHQIFMATVKEELSFAMRYNKCSKEKIREETNTMMNVFNLNIIQEHLTYHLSQGEKQRVALATILMNRPQYLILDEPFKGLDEEHKHQMINYLKTIHRQGVGILIITHNQYIIKTLADRVLFMGGGYIEYDKSV